MKPTVVILPNLNVAVFDELGQQIPELQKSLPQLFAENAEKCGYDPDGWILEMIPIGTNWRLFRTDIGWNREAVELTRREVGLAEK